GKELASVRGSPRAAGFSRDGHVWVCDDEPCTPHELGTEATPDTLPVLDIETEDLVPVLRDGVLVKAHDFLTCHAFHPDRNRFSTCSPEGLVRVWDLRTLQTR